MSNGWGGKRAGAGRPRKAERYAPAIAAAEDAIADQLPKLLKNMVKLANGGFYEDEIEYQPAGLVTTGAGEFERCVYPDKPVDELVVVKKRRRRAAPDRKANEYLIDRILGRPTQAVELSGEDGGPIAIRLSDDERAARVAALLDRGRARRAGLLADGEPGELPHTP